MPSSATTRARLEKQFTGENVSLWGELLNRVFDRIDEMVCGLVTVALTGNASLTSTNYVEDQARYAMVKFTGTGPYVVTIPSVQKQYRIWNACSAAITLTTGSGSTVTIDPGDVVDVLCDATNVKAVGFGGLSLKDYISSVVVGGGAVLPSVTGNGGKWLTNDGTTALWAHPTTSDLSDIATYRTTERAFALVTSLIF